MRNGERKWNRIKTANGCAQTVKHDVHIHGRGDVIYNKCPANFVDFEIVNWIKSVSYAHNNNNAFLKDIMNTPTKIVELVKIIDNLIADLRIEKAKDDKRG